MKQYILVSILIISYTIYSLFSNFNKDILVILDVGQGDSIFFQSGEFQMLIDTGPDANSALKISKYMDLNDKNLEYLILTHNHNDHTGGLSDILRRYNVRTTLHTEECFETIDGDNINSVKDLYITSTDNYKISVLSASHNRSVACTNGHDVNNTSLITVIENQNNRSLFVLMGDLEKDAESKIIEMMSGIISFDSSYFIVLKAGHHCSDTSSGDILLEYLKPDLIVCSVGENNFGHPNGKLLEKFTRMKTPYYLTKDSGDLIINLNKVY